VYTHHFGTGTCDLDELAIKESAEKMKFSRHLDVGLASPWHLDIEQTNAQSTNLVVLSIEWT
jgi:hypothetical protein